MSKSNPSAILAAAFALALSGAAFANDPPADPAMSAPPQAEVTFEQLDTDADGFVAKADIPVENELSVQFAVADSDADARLSRAEYDAYQTAPEEEEAEE